MKTEENIGGSTCANCGQTGVKGDKCPNCGKKMSSYDEAIECRAAVQLDRVSRNEIVFLPAGLHAITPVSGGIGTPIKVLVDATTAGMIEEQRGKIEARTDKRVYFDFNHEDGRASFWPLSFHWRAGEGVVCKGEWSASGRNAVEGKDFRAFSPVFHVDNKRGNPARVICCDKASPNMGGLVNDPAFSALPLWAKNDGSSVAPLELTAKEKQEKENKETKMTTEEIAALQAKKEELEGKVAELEAVVAKNKDDSGASDELEKYRAEARTAELELEAEKLKALNASQAKEIEKRNKAIAEEEVKAAVKRGAILTKDVQMQRELVAKATVDPSFNSIIRAMQGPGRASSERVTRPYGSVEIVNEDPFNVYQKLARLCASSVRTTNRDEKVRLAEEVSALYAGAFKQSPKNEEQRTRLLGAKLSIVQEAIMAGDVTDSNLGTIAGTLVTQRTLELLKFIFPPLTRFTTDFSDQPATFNQSIIARTITMPSVVTYSTATGWPDSTAATTDVPVVLNNHKGVQITFNEQLLASTMRRLFEEQAEAQAYQLAKTLVDAIYANLTDANFTNNSVFASTAFNRAAVVDLGVALSLRGVPLGLGNRTLILWPAAFGNLEKDSAVVQFATNVPRPAIVTDGVTPASSFSINIEAFDIFSAPNLPSNNANLVGFAGSKSALVIVTRTPNDYTTVLPGASFGNVQMVTDPDIGMTVMQVQYVNHTLGTATSRIALMYGTAAGQTAAGQLVKAASGTGSAR